MAVLPPDVSAQATALTKRANGCSQKMSDKIMSRVKAIEKEIDELDRVINNFKDQTQAYIDMYYDMVKNKVEEWKIWVEKQVEKYLRMVNEWIERQMRKIFRTYKKMLAHIFWAIYAELSGVSVPKSVIDASVDSFPDPPIPIPQIPKPPIPWPTIPWPTIELPFELIPTPGEILKAAKEAASNIANNAVAAGKQAIKNGTQQAIGGIMGNDAMITVGGIINDIT